METKKRSKLEKEMMKLKILKLAEKNPEFKEKILSMKNQPINQKINKL